MKSSPKNIVIKNKWILMVIISDPIWNNLLHGLLDPLYTIIFVRSKVDAITIINNMPTNMLILVDYDSIEDSFDELIHHKDLLNTFPPVIAMTSSHKHENHILTTDVLDIFEKKIENIHILTEKILLAIELLDRRRKYYSNADGDNFQYNNLGYDVSQYTDSMAAFGKKKDNDPVRPFHTRNPLTGLTIDGLPIGIIVTNLAGFILDVNLSFSEIVGYSKQEIYKFKAERLYSNPCQRKKFINRLINKKEIRNTHIYLLHKDGTELSTYINSVIKKTISGDIIVTMVMSFHGIEQRMPFFDENRMAIRTIMNQMEFLFIITNQDLLIHNFNNHVTKLSGLVEDEILGRDFGRLFVPEIHRGDILGKIEQARATKEKDYYFEYIYKDGEAAYNIIEWRIISLEDEKGILLGYLITGLDISTRKTASDWLINAQKKYFELLRRSPFAIIRLDKDGIIKSFNNNAEIILGWKEVDIIEKEMVFLASDERRQISKKIGEPIQGMTYYSKHSNAKKKNGNQISISIQATALTNELNDIMGFVVFIFDDTIRRNLEQTLRVSESKFNVILDNLPFIMYRFYPRTGLLTYVNNAFCQLTKMPRNQLIGRSIYKLMSATERNYIKELEEDFAEAPNTIWKNQIISMFGSQKHFQKIEQPIFDQYGKLEEIQSLGIDVSDIYESHEAIKNLTERNMVLQEEERRRIAQELHDGVGQYISASKMSFKNFVEDPVGNTDIFEKGIKYLDSASQEIRQICRNLYPAILQDLGLEKAIDWYCNFNLSLHEYKIEKNINIMKTIKDTVSIQVFRILQEALNNVVKYAKAENIYVNLIEKERFLSLEIGDDGLGFDFKQYLIDRKTNPHFGLLGMQYRSESLGGSCRIYTRPGEGTRIQVQIPIID